MAASWEEQTLHASKLRYRRVNRDVVDTVQAKAAMEEALCSNLNQLQSLCAAQLPLATEGLCLPDEEQLNYLRLLKRCAEQTRDIAHKLFC